MAPKGAIIRLATSLGLSVVVVVVMMVVVVMLMSLCTRDRTDRERDGGDGGQYESELLHNYSWS
jgi:uncharacterized membrane protein